MVNVSGFTVIPVSYDSSATHYLYARSHSSRKGKAKADTPCLPDGRTLFLVNVPPDATERELMLFFKNAGTVEKVIFDNDETEVQDKGVESEEEDDDEDVVMVDDEEAANNTKSINTHRGRKGRKGQQAEKVPKVIPLPAPPLRRLRKTGLTAHVVFLDASSLERATIVVPTSKPRLWPSSAEEPCGIAHYQALYTSLRPPLDAVRAFADSSMEVYEYNLQKEKQKSKYKKGEAIVDDDGFTLVTRGGAYGKTLGGGVGVASKQFQRSVGQARSRSDKKKEKREKEGFYGFQKAERQRTELLELKRKWEEDKARVEKLKASRRFKPY